MVRALAFAQQIELDRHSWITHENSWCDASLEAVLDESRHLLAQPAPITIYGRTYPVPRLVAWLGRGFTESSRYAEEIAVPPIEAFPILTEITERARDATGVAFDSLLLNYYRDGADSVGWHTDDEGSLAPGAPIAAVSLGAARRFRVRSELSGETRTFTLADGDLLVMGGDMQRRWKHSVPKMASAGERLSLTFRVCA